MGRRHLWFLLSTETGNIPGQMERVEHSNRLNRLRTTAALLSVLLLVKVLFAIIFEYRWYFPANFDSTFLIGRRGSFFGAYQAAFYTHIISGPLAVLLGSFLMLSGGRSRYRSFHRRAGQTQIAIIFLAIVPSGLLMASQALAGPVAAVGFAALSLATAASAATSLAYALRRRYLAHQRWAARCFLLLCSPLILRLFSGAAIVLDQDTDWFYRLNAWLSWLIPLGMYEAWRRIPDRIRVRRLRSAGTTPTGKDRPCQSPSPCVTERSLADLR